MTWFESRRITDKLPRSMTIPANAKQNDVSKRCQQNRCDEVARSETLFFYAGMNPWQGIMSVLPNEILYNSDYATSSIKQGIQMIFRG
jgi:hypothetical protein